MGRQTIMGKGAAVLYLLTGTPINPLKPRWRCWKWTQNAHVLRVHSAFSPISALPSRL